MQGLAKQNYLEAERRREEFLTEIRGGLSPKEACELLGITPATYRAWRSRDSFFAAEVDSIRTGARQFKEEAPTWENFAEFRKLFFGHETPFHQAMIVNALEQTAPGDITMVLVPPEHGKGLRSTERIIRIRKGPKMGPMLRTDQTLPAYSLHEPEWVTMADLEVGDYVFGRHGGPTKVLGVYPQGMQPMRRVHFSDGTFLDCDLPHRWRIRDRNIERRVDGRRFHPEFIVETTYLEKNLLDKNGRPRLSVPMSAPLATIHVDLPIDPWALGYWLGNGATDSGLVVSHQEDAEWVKQRFAEAGFIWEYALSEKGVGTSAIATALGLSPHLRGCGLLGCKHIPHPYLFSSIDQRKALLAGLLDSDGYSGGAKGQVELCFTNKQLARDAEHLVRSLGIKVRVVEGESAYKANGVRKVTGTRYRLIWTDHECRFTSPRKRAMFRPSSPQGDRLRWKVIERIEELPEADSICIRVEDDEHMFVVGEFFNLSMNTTLFEDYASMKLATDPEYRITVGCEAQGLSRRILGRIKNRMEENGPFKKYVQQFGPFVPQNMDGNASRQTWSQDYFNVYKRRGFDERDYNMVGIGFGSNIAGSRTDHLHCDDLQSLKTIAQTEKMVETFRQDWLSRPGETGITTINGTRVADGDIYEKLEEHFSGEDFFRVVRLPAIVKDHTTGEERPLWPRDPDSPHKQKGYTMEMLDRLRKKVGEDAWSRNYMQKPRAQGLGTFTVDIVDRCLNPGRGIDDPLPDNGPIYIGLDPALGGINCLTAWQVSSKKLYLVAIQEDRGLARNEQIMDGLESMVLRMQGLGGNVTDVVIEAMNFQRGLARDERLQEMAVRYGFSLREHLTGVNKYDPDIGVPSMTSTFIKKEIDMPWKADERTRELVGEFREQHLRWKPGVKGNVLRQDMVMSEWFVWILWQSRRRNHLAAGTNFKGSGLPWTPTTSGLLLPAGASPFYGR